MDGSPGASLDLEDVPDALVVADGAGYVVSANRAAARLTANPDLVGKPLADALPLQDFEGRRWWDCVDPYGGLATRTGHRERTLMLPSGRELLVASRYVRERHTGPVVRVVVALRDPRTRDGDSSAELISTVAHELRSPLTSVKGFTATLLRKWDRFTDEQKRLMLETVDADADRVTRLITELLDIARIDSGRLSVRKQVVDVAAAVERHVAAHVRSGEDPARFDVRVSGPLPVLWADPDRLDQVLANLLENAVRHGDGRVTIVVERAGPDPEATAVTVMDEGEGIPEELHARVFTKWWRSGKRGGTGLGLYIVRGLVEAHGGHIEIGSSPAGGAMFRFVLPAGVPDFAS